MRLDERREVSAQVVLRPAGGRRPPGATPATAKNVAEFLPSPEAVREAQAVFQALKFRTEYFAGNSFAITAPAATFERVFRRRLRRNAEGGIECVGEDGTGSYEFPLDRLPSAIAPLVEVITMTPPPAFGPTISSLFRTGPWSTGGTTRPCRPARVRG